jgi:hypothetical protein
MADRVPPGGVDVTTPNVARIYDYMLGGKDNFAVDREAAEQILKALPEMRDGVRHARRFLGNAVRYLAEEVGIRQFVDIGAGLPAQNNVHEVAHSVDPEARTVYVDNDPVVCVHGRAILANSPTVAMIQGDLIEPEKIIVAVTETGLIEWSEPVGVFMLGILHYFPDPYDVVARVRESVAPGSHLAISHMSMSESRIADIERTRGVYATTSTAGLFPRTREDINRFFGDFELLDLARFVDDAVLRKFGSLGWGGVGRKK